ncbi:MAG TPA: glycogen/starch/alpha-glucan phosphorylase [Bryobacteraceae bacterium]|jgi:starch phosphorylase|nr:glycogen/starch/alpha-glucan phosphorylase [Bryobacteraceae bacterium]
METAITQDAERDQIRTGIQTEDLKRAFIEKLIFDQGHHPQNASTLDHYLALASVVRDRLTPYWLDTEQVRSQSDARVVCYFSAEFLLGPHMGNNLLALGIEPQARDALRELGLDFKKVLTEEEEPGLGNGGLGRLAACFLDSLATLQIPAFGFGIRYEFGIFDQTIRDGWQVEITDRWLQWGNPWEVAQPEDALTVSFGGHSETFYDKNNRAKVRWVPVYSVRAIPYDTPIPGYRNNTVNTLRLWKAEALDSFNFQAFNEGDYIGSVRDKTRSENISKILYPNDEDIKGKELRLEQQFFFVSASLQNIIRLHLAEGRPLERFHERWAVQMNDTHPSIAVAELMRLLIDEHDLGWDEAWLITVATLGYTNHTLLPEALEKWSIGLFSRLLPRHLEIIYEINRRFLEEVHSRYNGDTARVRRLSLIDEDGERYVRMAHLATVGSHAINGVAALHTELLKKDVLRDLYQMYPERFSNKTNGVTPRRWLALANPDLTELVTSCIGNDWVKDLDHLKRLEPYAGDSAFREKWRQAQQRTKERLVSFIHEKSGVLVNPVSMFDVMVKRIHEYKRQHLAVLHIITLYHRIKQNPDIELAPRTCLFGGKAAPGYRMAKLIIKLVNSVADVVNNDPQVGGRVRVVFLPDYNVTFGQQVYPAADLSEQISLAGKEASGTGNMKFALNGALTIGTLDGANIEIRNAVGPENFFHFGLTAREVYDTKARGYRPGDYLASNEQLRNVVDSLASGEFSRNEPDLFRPLVDSLRSEDPYMLCADYQAYVDCQDRVSKIYADRDTWARMSILNTARMGYFSSDRAIREYCAEIWHARPLEAGGQKAAGV